MKLRQKFVQKRSYKHFDVEKFQTEVEKIHWWPVYSCTNVDKAVAIFTRNITSILDRQDMAPVKTFQSCVTTPAG